MMVSNRGSVLRLLLWQWRVVTVFTVAATGIAAIHQLWLPQARIPALPLAVVGGALGIIMLGLIGTTAVNPAGANGLLFGGGDFFVKQVVAVLVSSIYAFGFTWVMLWLIDRTTPVKTTEAQEKTLDESLHGEQAYLA